LIKNITVKKEIERNIFIKHRPKEIKIFSGLLLMLGSAHTTFSKRET